MRRLVGGNDGQQSCPGDMMLRVDNGSQYTGHNTARIADFDLGLKDSLTGHDICDDCSSGKEIGI